VEESTEGVLPSDLFFFFLKFKFWGVVGKKDRLLPPNGQLEGKTKHIHVDQ